MGKLLGILALFTSLKFLGRILIPLLGVGVRPFVFFSDLAFCLVFSLLFLVFQNRNPGRRLRIAVFLCLILFCFIPLFDNPGGIGQYIWLITLPFFSVFLLGYQIGLYASVILFIASLYFFWKEGFEPGLQYTGAYMIVLTSSYYLCRSYYRLKKMVPSGNDHLPSGPVSPPESHPEKEGDFNVYYRRDVLHTLERIPSPDAVLSYVLLEGVGDVDLFGDEEEHPGCFSESGDYLVARCSVEDFLGKIDSVIELRKTKKRLEYNKIQTQLHNVLPQDRGRKSDPFNIGKVFESYSISDREGDIIKCILGGMTNKEISRELYISIETVKTHVRNILKKCNVSSRIELIKLFTNSSDFI